MKKKFKESLISELIWTATKQGAFQRARIYRPKKSISNDQKMNFRNYIKTFCYNNLYGNYLTEPISEEELIELIDELCKEITKRFKSILNENKFQFGNAQKFINLYLKQLWIIGKCKEPPHFPVDRIIQEGFTEIRPWTNMGKKAYLLVIKEARKKAKIANLSLALWEAQTYDRYNQSK